MNMPSLSLHVPPTVNHYWLRNRNGSIRVSDDGIRYRIHAAFEFLSNTDRTRIVPPKCVRAVVHVWWPDARDRNSDNIEKCLWDALTHAGAWENDNQIRDRHVIECGIDRDDPRVEVHWEAIDSWAREPKRKAKR